MKLVNEFRILKLHFTIKIPKSIAFLKNDFKNMKEYLNKFTLKNNVLLNIPIIMMLYKHELVAYQNAN